MAPAPEDGGGRPDLLAATADLVAIASVSHHEDAIAAWVEKVLAPCSWLTVVRLGDNVVARTDLGRDQRLVLAGHLDTVPPGANAAPRVEGDTLWGVGASDMKGGLAVMLDVATSEAAPAMDLTWCFYAREEVGRDESGLRELWHERPDLLAGDAAVLGEPTDALVEAGCQGTLRIRVTVRGVRAHTARPFTGRNAIHRLGELIARIAGWPGREVVLDGCTYAEQVQVVAVDRRGGEQRGAGRGEPRGQPSVRARPQGGRGGGVPAPAPRPGARARGGRHLGAPRRRRRGAALARPSAAGLAGGAHGPGAAGQGGLDRRGVVLGARRPRRQLRPG